MLPPNAQARSTAPGHRTAQHQDTAQLAAAAQHAIGLHKLEAVPITPDLLACYFTGPNFSMPREQNEDHSMKIIHTPLETNLRSLFS
jgi:hypothetical protein